MRGEEMLDKMELIDPEYIEEAESANRSYAFLKIKAAGLVACLILIITGVILGVHFSRADVAPVPNPNGNIDREDEPINYPPLILVPGNQLDEPAEPYQIIINETESAMDGSRKYIPGYFTEDLTEQNASALLPTAASELNISGFIGFDGDGNAIDVIFDVTAPDCPSNITVSISPFKASRIYDLEGEPEVSVINGTEFTIYRCTISDRKIWLDAAAEVNGNTLSLFIESTPDTIEQDQELFCAALEYFSCYEDGQPDIAAIKPQNIPEHFDIPLSIEEAVQNADFGEYILRTVPDGFTAESIRRYKDQNSDYLSGLWTKGYDELSWNISRYSDEYADRMTGVDEKANYDLSLYPIPRADSVPDELRDIVNDPIFIAEELTLDAVYARAYKAGEAGDSDGWRFNFSIRFDHIIVTVRAKGVDPEWIFELIKAMI